MEYENKLYLTNDENKLFDNHYRYKISTIQTYSIIKKGTYITILDNFDTFCNELLFDKNILIKIIGKIMSCKSGVSKDGNYYLQGQYDNMYIKNIVYTFIKKYLICSNCGMPEVTIKCKNDKIKQKCKACGYNDYLENCREEIVHLLK
jgi:translation initiation factor 2 beta subunit (eIF-2beta)/eIF-5